MKKCEKCGKPASNLISTLMQGVNGFRRYKICPSCAANHAVELSKKLGERGKLKK